MTACRNLLDSARLASFKLLSSPQHSWYKLSGQYSLPLFVLTSSTNFSSQVAFIAGTLIAVNSESSSYLLPTSSCDKFSRRYKAQSRHVFSAHSVFSLVFFETEDFRTFSTEVLHRSHTCSKVKVHITAHRATKFKPRNLILGALSELFSKISTHENNLLYSILLLYSAFILFNIVVS